MPLTEHTAAQDIRYHLYQISGLPWWTCEVYWTAPGTNTAVAGSPQYVIQDPDPLQAVRRALLTVPQWRRTVGH